MKHGSIWRRLLISLSAINDDFYQELRTSLKHGDGKIPEEAYREWLVEKEFIEKVVDMLENPGLDEEETEQD
jgi:hypothetical protein